MFSTSSLIESRIKVAELRNSIRTLKHKIETTQFRVENDAIKSVEGNYGKNAEERERFLKNAIYESKHYVNMEEELISLQNSLELEEATLFSIRDLRRELELEIKHKMIEVGINIEENNF